MNPKVLQLVGTAFGALGAVIVGFQPLTDPVFTGLGAPKYLCVHYTGWTLQLIGWLLLLVGIYQSDTSTSKRTAPELLIAEIAQPTAEPMTEPTNQQDGWTRDFHDFF